jgi:hypothetical protein
LFRVIGSGKRFPNILEKLKREAFSFFGLNNVPSFVQKSIVPRVFPRFHCGMRSSESSESPGFMHGKRPVSLIIFVVFFASRG